MRSGALASAALIALAACAREPPADVPEAPRAAPGAVPAPPPGAPAGEIPPWSREPADPPSSAAGEAGSRPEPEPPAVVVEPSPPAAPPEAAAPPPAPTRPPVSEPVREALDAAAAKSASGRAGEAVGDLADAERRLGEVSDLRLAQARAFLALAEESAARGEDGFLVKGLLADAELRWKQATALDPEVPGAAVVRARIQRFARDPAAARETLRARLAQARDDVEAHTLLAEMATEAREWEAADDHWSKVAQLRPDDGRARLQATIAKQWLRAPAERIEAGYLEAIRLLPGEREPVELYVTNFLNSTPGRDRDAKVAALRKIVAADPQQVRARLWIAHFLRAEGTPDLVAARVVLEDAAKIAPADPEVQCALGQLLEAAGEPLAAVKAYVACVENGEAEDWAEVSDALDRLLNAPDSPIHRTVPLTLRVRACDALVAKNPSDGRYGNNCGLWFRDVGKDYGLSLKYYAASCEAAPDDQDFLNDTGLLFLFHLRERKDECLRYFDRVVALVEEDGRAPERGYWDTLENLCKYWYEEGEWARVVALAKRRANPAATLDGRPYPSAAAARWGQLAAKKLAEEKR